MRIVFTVVPHLGLPSRILNVPGDEGDDGSGDEQVSIWLLGLGSTWRFMGSYK